MLKEQQGSDFCLTGVDRGFDSFQRAVGFRSYVDMRLRTKLFFVSSLQPSNWETTFKKLYPPHCLADTYVQRINSFIKEQASGQPTRDVFGHMFELIDKHMSTEKPVKLKDILTFQRNPSVWKVMSVAFGINKETKPDQVISNSKDVIKLSLLCADIKNVGELLNRVSFRVTYDLKQALINLKEKKEFLVFDEDQSNTIIALLS